MIYKFKNFLKKIINFRVINFIKYYFTLILYFYGHKRVNINFKNFYNFDNDFQYSFKELQSFSLKNEFKYKTSQNSESTSLKDQYIISKILSLTKPKNILEIGTFSGETTLIISETLYKLNINHMIDTIDLLDVNKHIKENFLFVNHSINKTPLDAFIEKGLENNVKFIKTDSKNFFRNNIKFYDLIFIDGSHRYNDVIFDIVSSINILNNRGLILVHDYYNYFNETNPKKILTFGPYFALKKITKQDSKIKILEFKYLFKSNSSLVALQNIN